MSLKAATRERRLVGADSLFYRTTGIASNKLIPKLKLLSHTRTKETLCEYLAHLAKRRYADCAKVFVVAYLTINMYNKSCLDMEVVF